MLYELLTGRVPFDGDSAGDDRAQAGQRGAGAAERATTPPSPPELDAVVLRALAKDPADRFPDADAFIAALEDARRAPAATASHRPRAGGLRPRAVRADRPVPGRHRGPRPRDGGSRWWLWVLGILLVVAVIAGVLLLTHKDQKLVPERRRGRPGVRRDDAPRRGLPGRQRHPDVREGQGDRAGPGPAGRREGRQGLDGDPDGLRRPREPDRADRGGPDLQVGARSACARPASR